MWLLTLSCTAPSSSVQESTPAADSAADTARPDSPSESDPPEWSLEFEVFVESFLVLETNLPVWAQGCDVETCEDVDQDGLNDAWEDLALQVFRPELILDEAEPGMDDPDLVLAQVGRVAPVGSDRVRVLLMLGWSEDYGRCGVSAHHGDSERVALDVLLDGERAVVVGAYTAAHEGTALDHGQLVQGAGLLDLSTSEEPRWQVWPSEGKHATYPSVQSCEEVSIVPCIDEDCAPDGVDDPERYVILPDVWNAGEEAAPRLTGLSELGFPGDEAWLDQPFCGGGDRSAECSSAVREKLLDDPFEG